MLNLRGSNLGCQYGPSSRILIWDSQEATHPSTNRARCCLTCEFGPQRPELGPCRGGRHMYGHMEILPCSTGLCPLQVGCPKRIHPLRFFSGRREPPIMVFFTDMIHIHGEWYSLQKHMIHIHGEWQFQSDKSQPLMVSACKYP